MMSFVMRPETDVRSRFLLSSILLTNADWFGFVANKAVCYATHRLCNAI